LLDLPCYSPWFRVIDNSTIKETTLKTRLLAFIGKGFKKKSKKNEIIVLRKGFKKKDKTASSDLTVLLGVLWAGKTKKIGHYRFRTGM
jgi:hypothetical protein